MPAAPYVRILTGRTTTAFHRLGKYIRCIFQCLEN